MGTNESYPDEKAKFFQNDSNSITTSSSTESNYETTQPKDDKNLLDEKFSTILPIPIPVSENRNQSINSTFQPLILNDNISLTCNKILSTLKVITQALVNLFNQQQ